MLAWNVQGLTDAKKESGEFVNIITQNDIIFLLESWTNCHSKIDIGGYVSYNFYRKYQHRNARRSSGGIVVYLKESVKDGVTIVRNHYDSVIWLKVDKSFFHTTSDVYLCGVYIWPEESPMYNIFNVDLFDVIQNDVYEFENKGCIYIIGDFNSRVGVRDDYINFDRNIDQVDSDDYIPDEPLSRASSDKTCNSFGLKLLDLCKSSCIRIVNGRLSNDCGVGSFTFASGQGASVIDYVLAKERDFVSINRFTVCDFNEWSDHCPLTLSIYCNAGLRERPTGSFIRYKWSDSLKSEFRSGLIGRLSSFNRLTENMQYNNRSSINNVVCGFTNIIREVADPLFSRRVCSNKSPNFIENPVNDKEWFDNECSRAK